MSHGADPSSDGGAARGRNSASGHDLFRRGPGPVTAGPDIGDVVDRFRAVVDANVSGTVDLLSRVEALVRRAVAQRPASAPPAADVLARLVDAGLSSCAEVSRHLLALLDGLVSVAERAMLPATGEGGNAAADAAAGSAVDLRGDGRPGERVPPAPVAAEADPRAGPVSGTGDEEPGEEVVLVDEEGREVGRSPKLAAHTDPGQLHRAVSVFVFSTAGDLLLQRRAPAKYHFAGRWSNTCCGHPRPGEPVVAAGRRRLVDELGMDCELVEVATFGYEARDDASGLVERELDHLLVGVAGTAPDPRPGEVDAVRWVEPGALAADIAAGPSAYTPWLPGALARVMDARRAQS